MEMVSWNRSKIMLVGQGRSGKTALARSMMGEPFKETPSTIGGEIFEREIREGSVKGGKLAEHKRPEKELEWMVARNGMKSPTRKRARPDYCLSASRNTKAPFPNGIQEGGNDIRDNQDPISINDKPTFSGKGTGKSIIGGRGVDIDIMFRLFSENIKADNDLSKLTISLCDFGGQDVFNALHAFFMTRCGVYMLVFDMELFLSKEEKDRESCHKNIKFWMNSIAMHTYDEKTGKTAPVALVGTRKDKISSVEEHERISGELKERYEYHRVWSSLMFYRQYDMSTTQPLCFFPVNNNTLYSEELSGDSTLRHLLEQVEGTMMESEQVKRKVPLSWTKALDVIREKGKKENKNFLLLREVTEIAEKLGISLEGVSELLRYLYEMGLLIWIEEPGLREIVILDPIEYFVKPVTRIICKHLSSKKDPYATKHELPIHKECQRELSKDWELMLEFGLVSETLAKRLLKNERHGEISEDHLDMVMLLMKRFGLMIPVLFQREAANIDDGPQDCKQDHEGLLYFIPSLLPENPNLIIPSADNRTERNIVSRLQQRFNRLSNFQPSQTILFAFFLPSNSTNDASLFSLEELSNGGFLPNGFFDRFIARVLSGISGLVMKSTFSAFQNIVRIDYKGKLIRFTHCIQQNTIKIEIQDSKTAFDIFQHLEQWLGEARILIRECYNSLEVKTLLPVKCEQGRDGFITLDLLRKTECTVSEYMSDDGLCVLEGRFLQKMQSEFYSLWPQSCGTIPASKATMKVFLYRFILISFSNNTLSFPSHLEIHDLSLSCLG
jgi:GTPase SAR1 family protein/DNA-binding MarR family transcriptional regulator